MGTALVVAGCVAADDDRANRGDEALSESRQVERVDQEVQGDELVVTLEVRNLGYDKRVGLRASVDDGDWFDAAGSYRETASDGVERWEVGIAPDGAWDQIRYAAFYEDLASGEIYWDNNDGQDYLAEHYPAVRRLDHGYHAGVLTIDLAVRNLAYDKVCAAIVTGDDWLSQQWEGAHYVGPIAGSDPDAELWRVELDADDPSFGYLATAAVVEYAVVCYFDHQWPGSWDNDLGRNYRFDRSYPVTGEALIDSEVVTDLEVAADGRVFAVTGGPWYGTDVEFYGADGALLATVGHSQSVLELVYVAGEELVLVETYGSWPDRDWTAYDTEGTELWTVSAPLEAVVSGGPGQPTFLVGEGGAALVGAAPPTVVGPTDRCRRFPVITAGGRLLCETDSEVLVYDVLAGAGGQVAEYPAGTPWAADDDGHVVLLVGSSELRGYDGAGQLRWTATSASYIPDHYLPTGGRCSNRAVGQRVGYTDSAWVGGESRSTFYAIDIATGDELFSHEGVGFGGPCAYPDGRFYLEANQYPFERLVRIDPAGARTDYPARGYLSQLDIGTDGAITALVQPPSEPYSPDYRMRLVLLDDQLVERFARTQAVTYPPGNPVVDASGSRLAISDGYGIELVTLDRR